MKDKTLIILDKITKNFNTAVDFLMSKTAKIGKKLLLEFLFISPIVTKKVYSTIHKIEKSEDWKLFEKAVIKLEKNIFKYIPKPILEILAYVLDSALYFVKTLLVITIKISKTLILETVKQLQKLPHAHKRLVFIACIVFITSMVVFINSKDHFDGSMKTAEVQEKTIVKDKTEQDIKIEEIIGQPQDIFDTKEVEIKYGDTLVDILQTSEIEYSEIHSVIEAMKECYNPKKLYPGKKIGIKYKNGEFFGLEISISLEENCIVSKTDNNQFAAKNFKKELNLEVVEKQATINSSLFATGEAQNIPNSILVEFIKMYSWDVDFVRDIRANDTFTIMYEKFTDDEGNFVKNGEIIYTNMNLSGDNIPLYRYKGDYFKEDGSNIRKALLRTPINGARISSPFGMRKHPILGFSKLHGGVDFAAPRGTPIYAAGDGKIIKRSYDKYNGNMIKIKHNSTYVTAYCHMNKFANIKQGSRVKQGQVIGYVGNTGRSTGAHLHYEIQKNGKKVNPTKVKLPNKQSLDGEDLKDFKHAVFGIRTRMGLVCKPTKKPKSI